MLLMTTIILLMIFTYALICNIKYDSDNINLFRELDRLGDCFPGSYIDKFDNFIIHDKSRAYFSLKRCHNLEDIEASILEKLTYSTFGISPYANKRRNQYFHDYMLKGINDFLHTDLKMDDMWIIYKYMGNGINPMLTKDFIKSGYNMNILKDLEDL